MTTPLSDTIPSESNSTLGPTITVMAETHAHQQPLAIIGPSKSWRVFDFRELWAYRELLYFLTWRDVKIRYKQTLLGAAWAILQPLMLMLIFTFFVARLGGIKTGGVPYPLFAFAGLLPWLFFANAVTNSGNSLVASTNLITKVYFPRLIIPAAAVAAGLVDFAIAFISLIGVMLYYRVAFQASMLFLPGLIALIALLAFAVGLLASALNVKYRDVRYALPFIIQCWMFASPVIYPVPENWRGLVSINPLTGIINAIRAALFGQPLDWSGLGISCGITLVLLVFSVLSFRRMEKNFADVI
jgi:lipopolysaccharide transport system permease protein